jgi:hypothetical protein
MMFWQLLFRGWVAAMLLSWAVNGACYAQKSELGIGAGISNYTGDVATGVDYRNTRGGFNLFYRYNANRAWSYRFDLTHASLQGKDEYINDPFHQIRNFKFVGDFTEVSARIEYNFFNFRVKGKRRFEKWCPYLFGGVAGVMYSGESSLQRNYNYTNFSIPFGVGVKHYINPKFNIGFDFGARKMFADNLDGIAWQKDLPKFQQVNRESTDMYYYLGFYVSYLFIKIRCPEENR